MAEEKDEVSEVGVVSVSWPMGVPHFDKFVEERTGVEGVPFRLTKLELEETQDGKDLIKILAQLYEELYGEALRPYMVAMARMRATNFLAQPVMSSGAVTADEADDDDGSVVLSRVQPVSAPPQRHGLRPRPSHPAPGDASGPGNGDGRRS